MSWADYWDGEMVHYLFFYEAMMEREKKDNEIRMMQAWTNGIYTYASIANLAPALQAFPARGSRTKPYPDPPIQIKPKEPTIKIKNEEPFAMWLLAHSVEIDPSGIEEGAPSE